MDGIDLPSILAFAKELSIEAGRMMQQGQTENAAASSQMHVNEKDNAVDLVTQWDVAVEKLIIERTRKEYPDFNFLGEETYSSDKDEPSPERLRAVLERGFCWVVDPIDGTSNYVHNFPFSCCSIGLAYKGEPILGVVHSPFLNETYFAARGHGAFLQTVHGTSPLGPNTLQPLSSLRQALVCFEYGTKRQSEILRKKTSILTRLLGDTDTPGGQLVQGIRSVGSGALTLCLIARGAVDLYWYDCIITTGIFCCAYYLRREIGSWPWYFLNHLSECMGRKDTDSLLGISVRALASLPKQKDTSSRPLKVLTISNKQHTSTLLL